MTTMTFGQKTFKVKPPDKGSFPLDHEGECKLFMVQYMRCLQSNEMENTKCRQESMDYLKCRMDKNLMTKEEFSKLGFADLKKSATNAEETTDKS